MGDEQDRDKFNKLLERARNADVLAFTLAMFEDGATKNLQEAIKGLTQIVNDFEVVSDHSIKDTYGSSNGDFKQPAIKLNTAAPPSVSGNIQIVGSEPLKIPPAEIIVNDEHQNMSVPLNKIKIPVKDASGKDLISTVAGDLDSLARGDKFEYANEAEVQGMCFTMIKDALKCLGLKTDDVRPHLEISIYTLRPDIILVLRRQGRIIFVVEIKTPELENGQVFESENVGGQIWSYLLALRAMGDGFPMGAVMTYNKIALATLDDYSKVPFFAEVVKKAEDFLSTGVCPGEGGGETEVPCQSRDSTPVKTVHFVKNDNPMGPGATVQDLMYEDDTDTDGDRVVQKKVFFSKVFKEGDVFPVLLQALWISYQKSNGANDIISAVENNDPLNGRLAFKISKSSFNWVKTNPKLKAVVGNGLPNGNSENFYILGKLGEGSKATVYLAANTGGVVCAMKNYYVERSNGRSDAPTPYAKVDAMSNDEAELWNTLYHRRFTARAMPLGGYPCLLMPYGRELVESDSSRWMALPDIKKILVHFAEKGFKYESSDLHWRHVLRDTENQIFLCDLESLAKLRGEEENTKVVWEQLKIFLQPMVTKGTDEVQEVLTWLRNGSKFTEVQSIITNTKAIRDIIADGDDDDWGQRIKSLFSEESIGALSDEAVVCLYAFWFWKVACKADEPESPNSRDSTATPGLVDTKAGSQTNERADGAGGGGRMNKRAKTEDSRSTGM